MRFDCFKEANMEIPDTQKLTPEQAQYWAMTYYSDGTNSVYKLKASWRERLSFLIFGTLWITMKLGEDVAPPMIVNAKRTRFEKLDGRKPIVEMVAKTGCKHCHGTGIYGKSQGKDIPCVCLRPKSEVEAQGHKIIGGR